MAVHNEGATAPERKKPEQLEVQPVNPNKNHTVNRTNENQDKANKVKITNVNKPVKVL